MNGPNLNDLPEIFDDMFYALRPMAETPNYCVETIELEHTRASSSIIDLFRGDQDLEQLLFDSETV